MDFKEFIKEFEKKKVILYDNNVVEKPLISVSVVTFQHVKYIRECLEGILMQKTSFPFEILLGDDLSTDGTREICLEYARRYPEKIRLFLHHRENNIKIGGRATGRFNFMYNLYSARGKYIALCEGDDFWTDSEKLQKQVDFLEENNEVVICSHNSNIINSDSSFNRTFNEINIPEINDVNYILRNSWYIPTASMVFRRSNLILPKWFYMYPNGDYMLQLILAANGGLIYYENKIRSSYRLHNGGVSNVFQNKNILNYSMLEINKKFNEISKHKYYPSIRENIVKYSFNILHNTPVRSKEFWEILKNLLWFNRGLNKRQFKTLIKIIISKSSS